MFAIAQANGVDRHTAYTLFEKYNPSGQISGRGKRMAAGDYEPTWTLDMAHKDTGLGDFFLRTDPSLDGTLCLASGR